MSIKKKKSLHLWGLAWKMSAFPWFRGVSWGGNRAGKVIRCKSADVTLVLGHQGLPVSLPFSLKLLSLQWQPLNYLVFNPTFICQLLYFSPLKKVVFVLFHVLDLQEERRQKYRWLRKCDHLAWWSSQGWAGPMILSIKWCSCKSLISFILSCHFLAFPGILVNSCNLRRSSFTNGLQM